MSSRITVNGKTIVIDGDASSVSIRNGRIVVNGKDYSQQLGGQLSGEVRVLWEGPLASLDADGNVTCGDVGGSVTASGSVEAQAVAGNATAGGSMRSGDVKGNVQAGGSVTCGRVGGSVMAGGSVRHG
jgi:hypothetical protein